MNKALHRLEESDVGKFVTDNSNSVYYVHELVKGCCHNPYFHLKEEFGNNLYAYSPIGERLDHRLQPYGDSRTNIKFD